MAGPVKAFRMPGWQTRLGEYVSSTRGRAFDWVNHNCVTFVAGAVEAMADQAICGELRGRMRGFNTDKQVISAMRREFGGVIGVLDAALLPHGVERSQVAREGDVLACQDVNGNIGSGICLGGSIAILTSAGTSVTHETTVVAAWRVPLWLH